MAKVTANVTPTHAHELLHDDDPPRGGRLDFMAKVMHTLATVEPRYESTVVAIARVDGKLKLDKLRERARELLQFWPMRCVLEGAQGASPRWRELAEPDASACVDTRLVTAKALPSEAELDRYIGDSFALPWDWTLPLWRIELLTFADAKDRSVVFVRMNHCVADGVAMLKMFLCLFDGGKANAIDPPRRRVVHGKPSSSAQAASPPSAAAAGGNSSAAGAGAAPHAAASHYDAALVGLPPLLRALATPPLALARRFWIAASGCAYGLLAPALPADAATALKLPSCAGTPGLSARRIAGTSKPIPFALVQEIKAKFGCTVNDVMVACVAGAVRRYELEQSAAGGVQPGQHGSAGPRQESGKTKVPAAAPSASAAEQAAVARLRRVRCLLPANLRKEGVDPLSAIGNEWTLLSVGLPADKGTPEARLRESIRRCNELKESPELALMLLTNKAGVSVLPPRAFAETTFQTMDKFTVLLSNVAGPPKRVSLLGCAVPHLSFFATSLVSTCFDLLTYDNKLQLTVLADPSVLPRGAAPLLRAFEDEVEALLGAARASPKPPPFDSLAWRRLAVMVLGVAATAACTAALSTRTRLTHTQVS